MKKVTMKKAKVFVTYTYNIEYETEDDLIRAKEDLARGITVVCGGGYNFEKSKKDKVVITEADYD